MNPDLSKLQAYPFEKLQALKQGVTPVSGLSHIALSIGEPRHPTPDIIKDAISTHLDTLSSYPVTRGMDELRETIANWLTRRFNLNPPGIDPATQVLPVNGTREALFAIAQCVTDRARDPLILMPNPFYQIYEGAALLAGAEPLFMNTTAQNGFLPDFDLPPETWDRCQLLYICSPGNPTGAVIGLDTLKQLVELAERHDFIIVADECYSELYRDEDNPPPGMLQACQLAGNNEFSNVLVFHSLSKRSNAPGLRSGFVAGDANLIERFRLYRTYHGCAMSPPFQFASVAAWNDEQHVINNRSLYREKFLRVIDILQPWFDIEYPEGGFYLWLPSPVDDTRFAAKLFENQNMTVIPGSYLSRTQDGINPGAQRFRIALVAELKQCIEAAERLASFMESRAWES